MSEIVEIFKILSPAIQAVCGGLIALFGSVIVQRKSHKKESNNFYREIIQECYRTILEIDDSLVDEKVSIQRLLLGDEDQGHWLEEVNRHSRAIDDQIKRLELNVNLYLPNITQAFTEYHSVVTDIYMLGANAVSQKGTYTRESYCDSYKKYEEPYHDIYINLRSKLEEQVSKYV